MFQGKFLILLAVLALAGGCAKKTIVDSAATPSSPVLSGQGEGGGERSGSSTLREEPAGDGAGLSASTGLARIYFDFDSFTLSDEARRILNANAEWLRLNPAARLVIEGHTDERGSDAYNLALGERRARAAREYLAALGIDPRRLSTISFGEERPASAGSGEEAWGRNRRGEFVSTTP